MNKIFKNKFCLLLAISCLIIVLGAVLYGVVGFNTAPDRPNGYTFEVKYNFVAEMGDEELDIGKVCEDVFKQRGLSYKNKKTEKVVDGSSLSETDYEILTYTFAAKTNAEKLAAAVDAVNAQLGEGTTYGADIFASSHALHGERFYVSAWRGAIAVAVAAIVALAYITIRFGVSCGVAGLAVCAHDALLTLALFAITRFPVHALAPVLYAAIAALTSLVLWVVLCGKLKEAFKLNEGTPSEELIRTTVKAGRKAVFFGAAVIGCVLLILGVIAVGGTALTVLPAIVAAAVPVYSVLFLAPEICIPVRKHFDKKRAEKKGGYVGKKKATATDAE